MKTTTTTMARMNPDIPVGKDRTCPEEWMWKRTDKEPWRRDAEKEQREFARGETRIEYKSGMTKEQTQS